MRNGIFKRTNSPILFLNLTLYEVFIDRLFYTIGYYRM